MTTELHGGCTLTLACELVDAKILDGASVKAALEEAAHVYGLDYGVLRDECEQRGIIEEPIPTRGMMTNLVCNECGSREIAVECVVLQDRTTGRLEIASVCDKGHVCNECGSENIDTATSD